MARIYGNRVTNNSKASFLLSLSDPESEIEQRRGSGRKFFAAQDRQRGALDAELCAADYKAQIGSAPAMDVAGHTNFALAFHAGIPDMKHDVQDVLATPDAVVVRFNLRGTHTG